MVLHRLRVSVISVIHASCWQTLSQHSDFFWRDNVEFLACFGVPHKHQRALDTLIHSVESLSNLCDWQSQCSGINNCLLCLSPHEMIAGVTAQQERSRKPKALYHHVAEGEIRAEPGHRVKPNSVFKKLKTIFKVCISSSSTCRRTLCSN